MNLNNLMRDLPTKNISSSDLMEIINYVMCILVETPIQETIEVNDWVISKIDEKTFQINQKYSSTDMSRFLHDDFTKRKLIKNVDKL